MKRLVTYSISAGLGVAMTVFMAASVTGGESITRPSWQSLFDGKSLDGWVVKSRPQDRDKHGYWKVVDGTITTETPTSSPHHYIWLLTEGEFDNFELRLRVQTYSTTTGNSGVQVRSRYDDEAGWMDGPQVDIHPPGPWRCGLFPELSLFGGRTHANSLVGKVSARNRGCRQAAHGHF